MTWVSLALFYHLSLSSIAYGSSFRLHPVFRAVVDRFQQVAQHLLVRVKSFTGVHRFWVRPYFSSRSRMSSFSNLEGFRDGRLVAIQQQICGLLPPGFVQYRSQHSWAITLKLFLHTMSQASLIVTWRLRFLVKWKKKVLKKLSKHRGTYQMNFTYVLLFHNFFFKDR